MTFGGEFFYEGNCLKNPYAVILDETIDCFYTTIIGVRELLTRYSNDSLFDCLVKLQYRLKEI